MDLRGVKSWAFQHGEKAILAIVVLFVAYSLYTYFTGDAAQTTGDLVRGGQGQKRKIPQHISPYYLRVAEPYGAVESIADLLRDPFWPPVTVELPVVHDLQVDTKTEQTLQAGADIDGEPRLSKPTREELDRLERLYPSGKTWMRNPCKVQVRVDPEAKDKLIVKALGEGYWTAYEATLANDDKCRVFIRVKPAGFDEVWIVVPPQIISAEEEEVGKVVVRFKDSPPPAKVPGSRTVTHVLPATSYRIYRQADHENNKRLIQEIPAGATGAPGTGVGPGRPVPPYGAPGIPSPGGVPPYAPRPGLTPEERMEGARPARRRIPRRPSPRRPGGPSPEELMEGRAPAAPAPRGPARAAPLGEGITAAEPGTYAFVDRSVESEASYTYWVEAYAAPDPNRPTIAPKPEMSEAAEVTTRQKFAILYIGGQHTKARVMVFIGSVDQYIAYRIYDVPIGGWIGEPPRKALVAAAPAAGAPKPAAPGRPGAAEGDGVDDVQFVTRFVLVDIIPEAYRAVEQTRHTGKIDPRTKKPIKRTVLLAHLARQIVVRNRKNELVRLWRRSPPKLDATTRTARRTPG